MLCEKFLLYSGEHYSVFFHAESDGFSRAHDYLLKLAKRISDIGFIYDETKFRIEDKRQKYIVLSQIMRGSSVSFL